MRDCCVSALYYMQHMYILRLVCTFVGLVLHIRTACGNYALSGCFTAEHVACRVCLYTQFFSVLADNASPLVPQK